MDLSTLSTFVGPRIAVSLQLVTHALQKVGNVAREHLTLLIIYMTFDTHNDSVLQRCHQNA